MKRIISLLLAVLMVLSVTSMTVFAAEENTAKEEVIYINLAADGSVKEVNAVNIFDLAADGKIVDYGNYQTVRNMTTTDKLCYTDDTVTADAKKGKLYYEGKLESNVIPWNVSVHYYMDGNEYTAEQIAGKSGSLKLAVSITENADCEGDFFDGYALQVTVTLDTDIAKNIKTDGATAANIGGDKQFTYTVLPAKGAEIEITADVTDFEMDPISINGVKLDLDIEIDESEIQGKVADITDAAELKSGTAEFKNATSDISSQISTEIDSMLADALGSETELTSFVSEKNTNIQSVQFVMQTEAVEVAEPTVAAPIAEEKLNFWQKLLKLFGL